MRGSLLRAAAGLLMAVIVADLVADTACDPVAQGVPAAATVRGAESAEPGEACGDVCIPDCFCCSRSTAAGSPVASPELQRLAGVCAPVAERPSAGARPVIDHPPPARA